MYKTGEKYIYLLLFCLSSYFLLDFVAPRQQGLFNKSCDYPRKYQVVRQRKQKYTQCISELTAEIFCAYKILLVYEQ